MNRPRGRPGRASAAALLPAFVLLLLALAAPRIAGASPSAPLYAQGLTGPGGQVWMGTHLWAADANGLCRLDADGAGTFAINAGLCNTVVDSPADPTFDPLTSSVYIPDNSSGSLGVYRLSFNPATETVGSPALLAPTTSFAGLRAEATTLGPDGKLYVSFDRSAAIARITNPAGPVSLQTVELFGQTSDAGGAVGLAFVGHDLYIAQEFALTRIANAAACSLCVATPTNAAVTAPTALAADSGGRLYIAETPFSQSHILRYHVAAGTTETYMTAGLLSDEPAATLWFVKALGFDPGGNLYVGDDASNGASPGQGHMYLPDSVPPAPPTFTGPASPANDNSPELVGLAEADSTVRIYPNETCAGVPVSTGSAATFASPGFSVAIPDNTTRRFTAKAVDAWQNVSACSAVFVYVEDSTAGAPVLVGSVPASPANQNAPKLFGSAEAGATVSLYENGTCTSPAAGSGTAAAFSAPGIPVSIADNLTRSYWARITDAAGNVSACSTSFVTYVEDSLAPAKPIVTSSSPASPANNNLPKLKGSAEAGSTVRLYANASCAVPVVVSGSAAAFASPGITVSIADNVTRTFWAQASDAAGNVSACSSSSVTYVEDSLAPAKPAKPNLDTASDSGTSAFDDITNDATPTFKGSAEAGVAVTLFVDGIVQGSTIAAADGGYVFTTAALSNGSHAATVSAADVAGNTSTSNPLPFLIDSVAPGGVASADRTRISPNGDGLFDTLTVLATFSEASAWTLQILPAAGATVLNSAGGQGVSMASVWNASSAGATVADGSYRWRLRATDTAGNAMAAIVRTVVVDTTGPAIGALTATPSPFTPSTGGSTAISFTLPEAATATIRIEQGGALVKQLPGRTLTGAGSVNVAWFGRNTAGALVAAGTYQAIVKAVDLAGNEATATINVVVS